MALPVQFKAKAATYDGRRYVTVPELKRSHADMDAFRRSRAFGGWANSDMFPSMLNRIIRRVTGGDRIWLDAPPEGVSIDASGFLAVVTIAVPDAR